jgi:hypothetical protein
MDPFLEGQLWPDFHAAFIAETRMALVPGLRPRYVALIEKHVYLEREPDGPRRRVRPDAVVVENTPHFQRSRGGATVLERPAVAVAAPVAVPLPAFTREKVERAYVEIRLRETRDLVTVIELLSPANKHPGDDGRTEYQRKRELVFQSGVHLVEIDLLRDGERLPMGEPLPPADYYAILSRAQSRPLADVWPIGLRHRLPSLSIPLSGDDPDAALDLQAVFNAVYDRAGYDYMIGYEAVPEPPLLEEDAAWVRKVLQPEPASPLEASL